MAFPFDQAYKLLAEEDPRGAITRVAGIPLPTNAEIKHIDRELNLERQHVDQAYLIHHEGQSYIHHFEAVTLYRSTWREPQLDHAIRLDRKYRLPIASHLLLYQERDTPAHIDPVLLHQAGKLTVALDVNIVRLWQQPAEKVLADNSVALYPWTALMDATPEQQREAARRIRDSGREGLAIQMTMLGSLRYGSRESFLERLSPMILTKEILRETPMWQEIQAEGRVEGEANGERRALTMVLVSRFGPLPESVTTRIATASQDTLERWITRAAVSDSLAASLD